jgi:hypothetical protein
LELVVSNESDNYYSLAGMTDEEIQEQDWTDCDCGPCKWFREQEAKK